MSNDTPFWLDYYPANFQIELEPLTDFTSQANRFLQLRNLPVIGSGSHSERIVTAHIQILTQLSSRVGRNGLPMCDPQRAPVYSNIDF